MKYTYLNNKICFLGSSNTEIIVPDQVDIRTKTPFPAKLDNGNRIHVVLRPELSCDGITICTTYQRKRAKKNAHI